MTITPKEITTTEYRRGVQIIAGALAPKKTKLQ
jgi:hypothetical protein